VVVWAAGCSLLLGSTTEASFLPADLNRDGVVDLHDVEIVQQSVGAGDPNIIALRETSGGPFILDRAGKTYVLQGPTTGHFTIQAANIVLDLNGQEVTPWAGGAGITVQSHDRITIKNGRIRRAATGIMILDSNDIHIQDLTVQDSDSAGIAASSSSHLSLDRVACTGNFHGMEFSQVQGLVATECEATENRDDGIVCKGCQNGLFDGIVVRGNQDGIYMMDCHTIDVRNVQALHNQDDGIDFRDTVRASVSTSVSDNNDHNLELDGGCNVIVRDTQYSPDPNSEHLYAYNVVHRFSSLRVRVVQDGDVPVVGARVQVYDVSQAVPGQVDQADPTFCLTTDYQGNLPPLDVPWYTRIGNLVIPSGPYRVRVSDPSFQSVEWSFDAHAPVQKTFVLH
jgi:nitrous oxidase accessory protein NosD